MSDATLAPAAARYLAQLDTALAAVDVVGSIDAATRDEILAGVREELVGLDAADTAARIRELGDPEFIAAEARAAASAGAASAGALTSAHPSTHPNAATQDAADAQPSPQTAAAASGTIKREPVWLSVLAALLVAVGGAVIPVAGAILGYVLVWISTAWTRRQKLVATLVPLSIMVIAGLLIAIGQLVASSSDAEVGGVQSPLLPPGYIVVWNSVMLLAAVQLVVGIWLLVLARRSWASRG